jgi:hypothetical protein
MVLHHRKEPQIVREHGPVTNVHMRLASKDAHRPTFAKRPECAVGAISDQPAGERREQGLIRAGLSPKGPLIKARYNRQEFWPAADANHRTIPPFSGTFE